MGNRPKPTRLRVLEGNRSKSPLPKGEPTPPVGAPRCPAWLCGTAKHEWRRLVRELEPLGMLTRIDGEALAHYCDLHSQAVAVAREIARPEFRVLIEECETQIAEDGAGVQTIRAKPNPLMRMSLQLKQQIRLFLIEFGMTPAARSRVKAATPPEQSKLQKFLHA